jgi:hypothetical protein
MEKLLAFKLRPISSSGRFLPLRPPRKYCFVSRWRTAMLLCTPMGFSFEDVFDSLNKICEVHSTGFNLAKLELLSWPVGASGQSIIKSVILLGGWRWLGPSSIAWRHNRSRSKSVKHFFLKNYLFPVASRSLRVPQLWQENCVRSCATSRYPVLRTKLYA